MSDITDQITESAHVVIVIVSTDEIPNIVGCLKSLDSSKHRDFGVIICENGGQSAFDRDVTQLDRMGWLHPAVLDERRTIPGHVESRKYYFGSDKRTVTIFNPRANLGYSGGVNACIAAAGDRGVC